MPDPEPPGHAAEARVAALFLRALGLVYASAFLSLRAQLDALIGSQGIVPASELLGYAREELGGGLHAALELPTLLWLTGASDWALHALCGIGAAAAALLVAGRFSLAAAGVAWLAYLSLAAVGDPFLSFQWDALLLEAGFVALFAASAEPRLGVWLARLLLFKLMFLSGAVKLLSGDPTWRDLTALTYHYWTQPLPAPTSMLAASLPVGFQKLSTALTLAIELGAPWGMLGPRRVRLGAAALLAALQLGIAATGNYGFFNLLTLALCGCLLDDRALRRFGTPRAARQSPRALAVARRAAAAALALLSVAAAAQRLTPRGSLPGPLRAVLGALAPFRSVNSYGLFAVMTTERPEILLEGSADGVTWHDYEFRWKPGDPERRASFTGPHMPRVDWQMWFAALGRCPDETWFHRFLERVLEGSQPVTAVFARDPFPEGPPRYLRTSLWQYRPAQGEERRSGAWWSRERVGPYCPVVTLSAGKLALPDDLPQ
ncbi:MAG TPA: lipase maturation factor family protein [Myxococcota bacterium]|nr:lipase maturation factor family protein [Myxococcota bacterium]